MKYKTFRALVIAAALGVGAIGVWRISACREEQRELEAERAREKQAKLALWNAHANEAAQARLREQGHSHEARLLDLLGQPAGGQDKLKDLLDGEGPKINVYAEGGLWARAKVDHDRDEKIDEKWSLDGGVVVRQIAPADDENYTRALRRINAQWVEAGAGAPPMAAIEAPPAAGPPALATGREVDEAVMRALQAPVQEKIKDATRGRPYKVNLYSDDRVRWNRLKIDLDRDDKWDEKWDLRDGGVIERQVAPADDENYSETYVLTDGNWTRK